MALGPRARLPSDLQAMGVELLHQARAHVTPASASSSASTAAAATWCPRHAGLQSRCVRTWLLLRLPLHQRTFGRPHCRCPP
jgi:hypothetical protein